MKSLFVNTVLGTTLAAALAVIGLGVVSETIFEPHYPATPAYPVQLGAPEAATADAPKEAEPDIATLLASATVEAGTKVAAQCASCHTFTEGGANGIGPNLHTVYGRMAGSWPGFSYSAGVKGFGQTWTAETLNGFLTSPKHYIEGTMMTFAGLKKPQDRANVIAYLHSLNPAAPPLPAPPPPSATPAPATSPEAAPPSPGAATTPPVLADQQSPPGAH